MFTFEPDRVAYFEAEGWRAYYDHRWGRLLMLLVQLCQQQFHIPFPLSLWAAYNAARGAAAWVPVDHDPAAAHRYYDRFYRIARRWSGLTFDPVTAAEWEMRYWDEHRQFAAQTDKPQLLETLVRLHCELFDLTPGQARESAEWRLKAADTVDLITSRRSTDVAGDWARIHEYLRQCYRSIDQELHPAPHSQGR